MAVMKRGALAAWLRTEKRLSKADAEKWAAQLQGLDQKFLSPLVDIAVDSGTPPLHVLAVLAEKHRDQAFVKAAKSHLAQAAKRGS
ncbi:hypothetical protein AB0I28_30830 [Phytomonospora sp. NPDC050363]|uniref:hypothetical protein n=1 Tax=Phytomonospora sp. NPDC050363 TaxID=3155642 RepID=UPI0033CF8152